MTERLRIGDMLVSAGVITEAQVQTALTRQKETKRRLGEELLAMGAVSEVQLTQMLSNQLSLPWVSLFHVEFTRELLSLLPAEVCDTHCAIPIYVRKVRRQGDTLYVAMDDPTNEAAVEEIAEACQLPVKAMVAPPSEIRDAVRVYYFGEEPSSAPEIDVESIRPPSKAPSVAPPASDADEGANGQGDDDPQVPAGSPSMPPPAATKGAFITMTLLDGTTVRLPTAGGGEDDPDEAGADLTGKDIVRALLAKAHGQDVSDVLPDSAVEELLATTIALLLRKGLVADWEFVNAWKKVKG